MKERKYSRRRFLSFLATAGVGLSACLSEAKGQTPVFKPSPFPVPTPKEITKQTPTEEKQIEEILFEAKKGEVLTLVNPLIGYIIRFPWVSGEAVLATLDTDEGDGFKRAGIVLSADCLYERFRQEGELGESLGWGVWRPNEKVDQLKVTVLASYSLTMPRPILEAESIFYKDQLLKCEQVKAVNELKEIVKDINWEEIPEDVGSIVGTIIHRFYQGFKEGFSEGEDKK